MVESVKKPPHYHRYKIEPITFIMQNNIPYAEGNAIKYLCRWRYKHTSKEKKLEDLRKAKQYIDILLELEEQEDGQMILKLGNKDE